MSHIGCLISILTMAYEIIPIKLGKIIPNIQQKAAELEIANTAIPTSATYDGSQQ